jgi:hypothetical protein
VSERPPKGSATRLEWLERRRLSLHDSMWHVPALMFAGQAFLLQVLSDPELSFVAAFVVLAAGLLASGAAALSLWQQRDREVLHSEAIAKEGVNSVGRLARKDLERQHPPDEGSERHKRVTGLLRGWIHEWQAYKVWLWALFAFAVADIAVVIDVQTTRL